MKNQQANKFLYLVEGVGAAFVAIFSAAYLFALPSMEVLHSEPTVKLLLSTFGTLFLVLIALTIILAITTRNKK